MLEVCEFWIWGAFCLLFDAFDMLGMLDNPSPNTLGTLETLDRLVIFEIRGISHRLSKPRPETLGPIAFYLE